MRILFGTHLREWGGGEQWMLTAARSMAARGHAVSLCAPAASEILARAREGGDVQCVAVDFVRDFDPISFGRVWKHCFTRRVEVFCLNMDRVLRIGGLAARLAGVPVVLPRRGSEFPLKGHLNYRFQYQVIASGMIVNSRATERTLLSGVSWKPRGKVHVLHNGFDLRPYDSLRPRAEVRAELGISPEAPVIVNLGELTTRKNAALLVSVMPALLQRFPDARLWLIGEGDQREALLRQASELGVANAVHLLGFRRDVPDLLGACDVLAHTAHVEGFGFAVAEAMAAGLPTVVTNASSLPEVIVEGETGALFEDDDAEGLLAALASYLEDPSLRRAHGEAGRKRVHTEFELEAKMDQLEAIFLAELGRKPKETP